MKSQVLHTVWCNISGEAAGEIWNWSPLGAKGLMNQISTPAACGLNVMDRILVVYHFGRSLLVGIVMETSSAWCLFLTLVSSLPFGTVARKPISDVVDSQSICIGWALRLTRSHSEPLWFGFGIFRMSSVRSRYSWDVEAITKLGLLRVWTVPLQNSKELYNCKRKQAMIVVVLDICSLSFSKFRERW